MKQDYGEELDIVIVRQTLRLRQLKDCSIFYKKLITNDMR